ncbi:DNA adenine methylase [Sutcliffiella cohnii]
MGNKVNIHNKKQNLVPVVKWAGGKRQLLSHILPKVPKKFNTYYEPFAGGLAVLLALQPSKAYISDANKELVNLYQTIITDHLTLISENKKHRNESMYYYAMRAIDRDKNAFKSLTSTERASRFILLNRLGYNGLWRENSLGQNNVPFGRYRNPDYVQEDTIINLHQYFTGISIGIHHGDFTEILSTASEGDFIYLDPPYDVLNDTSFTSYEKNGFNRTDQERLAKEFKRLHEKGCYVMLSNHATPFIKELYSDFNISIVNAKRNINSKSEGRGLVEEVLITNYD